MIRTIKIAFLFVGIMIVFISAIDVGAFGDESFRRQQFQADDGFKELDEEFAEPEPVKPPPPKIIIKERVIIKEILVPVPIPIPVPVPVEKTPAPQPTPLPRSSASDRTVSLHGLDFTLRGCRLAARNIGCDFTVISPNDDKELSLNASLNHLTSFFDNIGDQYYSNLLVFGNKQGASSVRRRLIRGIAIPIKLNFDNVSSKTSSIALLEFSGNAAGRLFTIKFRDVPLS